MARQARQQVLGGGSGGEAGPASALMDLPDDSYFADQWHLHNTIAGELDLNLVEVWPGYSGSGVEAFVIDDGFDYNHPDLSPNYDTARDYDYEGADADPYGNPVDDAHGTSTMGILGAARNDGGVVGVAYDATLVGYRVYSFISNRFITQIAEAIEDAADDGADVVSISLGSQYSANFFDNALDPAAMAALQSAIDSAVDDGRGGLGTNLVKSAGNGRNDSPPHNANASSWNADFKTISVAATDAEGQVTFYSTPGANILVAAFGSLVPGSVVTSDRLGNDGYVAGDIMPSFNGTSAAAPMVSGLVALMLEANPDLGWRDVQEILANAARQTQPANPTWVWNEAQDWNGGGFHHSVDLGFGLIDAFAAVRLAETWQGQSTTANLVEHAAGGLGGPLALPDADPNGLEISIVQDTTVGRIEFVSLRVDLPHTRAADLVITLTSPSGTTTTLLDTNAGLADHPDSWTYTAAGFRGEAGQGTWTVKIVDQFTAREGTLNDIGLTLHGSAESANDRYIFTEAFSEVAGGSGHSTTIADTDGGRDVVNAAPLTGDSTLDLGLGSGVLDGVSVAIDGIEDLVGGDGDDSFFGASGDNRLLGMRGDDSLSGGSGLDWLYGGSGSDTMSISGQGEIEPGEIYDGGSGTDSLIAQQVGSFPADAAVFDVEALFLYGTDLADDLTGASGLDLIRGLGGSDDIRGLDGSDAIYGGTANDVLRGNAGDDSLYGGGGVDTLFSAGGDDRVYGGSAADQVGAGSGSDLLFGDHGNDTLNGASGVDTVFGGSGSDTVTVDSAGDRVRESADGGPRDVVRSEAAFFALESGSEGHVEIVNLVETAGAGGLAGNEHRNTLGGNSADNSLSGMSGGDILNGRSGSDVLVGGSGNDTFVVDTQSDQLFELAGEGTDLVRAQQDFTLPDGTATAFIEILRLQGGEGALNGAGNSLDNRLLGNTEANAMAGLAGDDRLFGADGDDDLSGGSGSDQLRAHSGTDTLAMESGNAVFGGSGADAFLFDGSEVGTVGSGRPIVRDFDGVSAGAANGADKLVFATGLEVGSFAYIGAAAFSGGGSSEARYDGPREIEVDRDGDGAADQSFLIDGVTLAGLLTASDFIWL